MATGAGCTNEALRRFGKAHYTFINQVFGDLTVRADIETLYPNATLTFSVVPAGDGFEAQSMHHVLTVLDKNKNKLGTWCSVDSCDASGSRHQDTNRDTNDTLCQSYTLLRYLYPHRPIPRNRVRLQRAMVAMYRRLLRDPAFLAKFETIDPKDWTDYRADLPSSHGALNMTSEQIIAKIHEVLSAWESYGYHYYIGNGTVRKQNKTGYKCNGFAAQTCGSKRRQS